MKTPKRSKKAKPKFPKTVRLTEPDRRHFESIHVKRQQVVANAQAALNDLDTQRLQHAANVAKAYSIDSVDAYVWDDKGRGIRKRG